MEHDVVNHPNHYNHGKRETIDIMADIVSDIEFKGYLKCNIIKYISRYEFKNGLEDLKKARWYLNKLIDVEETTQNKLTNVEETVRTIDADDITLTREQFENLCKLP